MNLTKRTSRPRKKRRPTTSSPLVPDWSGGCVPGRYLASFLTGRYGRVDVPLPQASLTLRGSYFGRRCSSSPEGRRSDNPFSRPRAVPLLPDPLNADRPGDAARPPLDGAHCLILLVRPRRCRLSWRRKTCAQAGYSLATQERSGASRGEGITPRARPTKGYAQTGGELAFPPVWASAGGRGQPGQGLDPRLRRAEQFSQLVDAAVHPLPLG
jgi:hypothetical protein